MNVRVVSVTGPADIGLKDQGIRIVKEGEQKGLLPLEDVAILVLDGPDIRISHAVMAACVESKVLVLISNEKHLPVGLILPIAGHSSHTAILRDQIAASQPRLKQIWKSVVRAKILAQSNLVEYLGRDFQSIKSLIPFVRSGDPDNVEARAASLHFEQVFGEFFLRDRGAEGINSLLNYGYSVLRAAVARAVVGAGLHPALGVHHRNQYNALCLADDAMEPLRPLIDARVTEMASQASTDALSVNPATKRQLILSLGTTVELEDQDFPLLVALDRYAAALRRAICEGEPLRPPIPRFDDP